MQDLVLVVDQDADERRRIAAVLASDGLDVAQRATPIEGVNGVLDMKPALIVLAEETNPLEITEVISLTRRLTAAPVMVVGGGGTNREAEALQRGADTYLPRPFTVGELASRARMLIRRREDAEEERGRGRHGESSTAELLVSHLTKVS